MLFGVDVKNHKQNILKPGTLIYRLLKYFQDIPNFIKKERVYYAAAKSLQLCPTLCDPTDGSPPGSPVHGILQARILEWVAISFSNA